MKIEKWKTKTVAGSTTLPSISVEAVKLTEGNLNEVAAWCGGEVKKNQVSVPVQVVVGDPNRWVKVDAKTETRELKVIDSNTLADLGEYVVKHDDRFYVTPPQYFELVYEKENQ